MTMKAKKVKSTNRMMMSKRRLLTSKLQNGTGKNSRQHLAALICKRFRVRKFKTLIHNPQTSKLVRNLNYKPTTVQNAILNLKTLFYQKNRKKQKIRNLSEKFKPNPKWHKSSKINPSLSSRFQERGLDLQLKKCLKFRKCRNWMSQIFLTCLIKTHKLSNKKTQFSNNQLGLENPYSISRICKEICLVLEIQLKTSLIQICTRNSSQTTLQTNLTDTERCFSHSNPIPRRIPIHSPISWSLSSNIGLRRKTNNPDEFPTQQLYILEK